MVVPFLSMVGAVTACPCVHCHREPIWPDWRTHQTAPPLELAGRRTRRRWLGYSMASGPDDDLWRVSAGRVSISRRRGNELSTKGHEGSVRTKGPKHPLKPRLDGIGGGVAQGPALQDEAAVVVGEGQRERFPLEKSHEGRADAANGWAGGKESASFVSNSHLEITPPWRGSRQEKGAARRAGGGCFPRPRELQGLFTSMHRMHRIFSGNG